MKAIVIKGLEMPSKGGFLDLRIQYDGKVILVCGPGEASTYEAEEIEVTEVK